MPQLTSDLRYAARALLARPSLTAAAVLTLALGIGATTAIFSVVNAVVLGPLPLRDAGRLFTLCEQYPGATSDWCSIAPPNAEDVAAGARSVQALGIARHWTTTLTTPEGAENLDAGIASPGFFDAIGARAELGRLIAPSDLLGRESAVALITHEMWQARFGGARDVVGRVLTLDGKPVTIVGVIEPGVHAPLLEDVELWRPLHIDPRSEEHRDWPGFVAYGKLRPGVSLSQARAELAGVTARIGREHFARNATWTIVPLPLQDLIVRNVRRPLVLFLGAVAFVLLIGCANVANLLLARGAARTREMAVRAALGASRVRIARVLLTESVVLALSGVALGLLVAAWGMQAFVALAPAGIPRIHDVRLDGAVLGFAIALGLLTALVFGLAPALRLSRVDLARSLHEGGRGETWRAGRVGRVLVVGELALAVTLVSGAAVLTRTFAATASWNPGFEQDHLATFTLFAPNPRYTGETLPPLWDRLERELAAVPGVRGVATASAGPLFGGRETWEMRAEGMPAGERVTVRWSDVSPGYFATLGVPMVRGRDLAPRDRNGTARVALVNETLARRLWPGQDPLGKRVEFPAAERTDVFEVVGVVRDVPPAHPGSAVEPQLYWSNRQLPRPFTYFVVRGDLAPATLAEALRARVKGVDPQLDPGTLQTMAEARDRELRSPRFNMVLLVSFGLVALALAAIGTYGLLAYLVELRSREIGIRLALGASREQVVGGVVRQGAAMAAAGGLLGIAGSIALGKVLSGMVAGVSPRDPASLGASAVIVVIVAVVACAIPARRASRVDPAITLVAE